MKIIVTLLLLSTFYPLSCFAEKYAIVIGGSGEDFKKENFFLEDFRRFNNSLENRGFKVQNVFDSAKTQNKFQAVPATNDNVEAAIKDVFSRVKKGDQVAIFFHSHGLPQSYWNIPGHEILTESKDGFSTASNFFVSTLKETQASVLITDLSCYSGKTQELLDHKDKTKLALSKAQENEKICIMTAASPKYVSICSGDKASNSFTGEILSQLESKDKISAEDLFKQARKGDQSFTNMPQISSNPPPLNTSWDDWLSGTDPAGLDDNEVNMEGKVCEECMEKRQTKTNEKVIKVSEEISDKSAKNLLEGYRQAAADQIKISTDFNSQVKAAFATLTDSEKYQSFKGWSYSKVVFYADLQNIPSLKTIDTNGGETRLTKESEEFLNSFNYFRREQKLEMMKAMDKKELLGQFVQDLNAKIAGIKKQRDDNRSNIETMAKQILSFERKKYAKNFKSKKGNSCQKFQF